MSRSDKNSQKPRPMTRKAITIEHLNLTEYENEHEDLFFNPDPESPIAAVWVGRNEESGSVDLYWLTRQGRQEELYTIASREGFPKFERNVRTNVGIELEVECRNRGIEINPMAEQVSFSMLGHPGGKEKAVEQWKTALRFLTESSVISTDREIGRAMVDKMRHTLGATFRALATPSAAIEGPGTP